MKIYFIRHGETDYNKGGLIQGHTDIPLNEEGERQALEAALKLPDDISLIVCSDLIRCRQTAEIINRKFELPITFDARLREKHYGALEQSSWLGLDEAVKTIDRQQKYDYRHAGGESVEDVKERILACLEDIKEKHPEEKILISTHGGVIRLLHYIFNNGKVPDLIDNASIHEFDV